MHHKPFSPETARLLAFLSHQFSHFYPSLLSYCILSPQSSPVYSILFSIDDQWTGPQNGFLSWHRQWTLPTAKEPNGPLLGLCWVPFSPLSAAFPSSCSEAMLFPFFKTKNNANKPPGICICLQLCPYYLPPIQKSSYRRQFMLPDPESSFSSSHARQFHPYSHHSGQGWYRPGHDLIRVILGVLYSTICSIQQFFSSSWVGLPSIPTLPSKVFWWELLHFIIPWPGEPSRSVFAVLISFMSSLFVPHYQLNFYNYKLASRTCVSPDMPTALCTWFLHSLQMASQPHLPKGSSWPPCKPHTAQPFQVSKWSPFCSGNHPEVILDAPFFSRSMTNQQILLALHSMCS